MAILGALVLPHPPLIVPQVGRGAEKQVQKTIDAYREAVTWMIALQAETLVVISPHAPMYRDFIALSGGEGAKGDLSQFGAADVAFDIAYDSELTADITALASETGLPAGKASRGREKVQTLDHATMVPLYFLREAAGGALPWRFVRLGLSGLSFQTHYRLGMLIREAAGKLGRKVGIIASGDLSHYLKEDGPYGFRPSGPAYDSRVMDILSRGAFDELLKMPEAFCEQAGECGQRSFLIMAGCFDGRAVKARRLSYEGVTGVGYGVCLFEPGEKEEKRMFLNSTKQDKKVEGPDPYVTLAKSSYEYFVRHGRMISRPDGLPREMTEYQAGVFVSLKIDGQLRGCIGTISPNTASIADEIIQNAVSAAVRDPRFAPVRPQELPQIECSVDVLEPAEIIESPDMLDVKDYGVIVSARGRRGLLLPNLEGVDSVDEQISIARQKAGIGPREPIQLERFRVVRHI